jgi:hypothetical protein
MEPEVVRPLDGDPVTLRPCPPWCAEARHFADAETVHADDVFHRHALIRASTGGLVGRAIPVGS